MAKRHKKNKHNKTRKHVKPATPALRSNLAVPHTGHMTRAVPHTGHVTLDRQNKLCQQVVVYDSRYAEVQERIHGGVCCVCVKPGYFMSTCQRCQVSKYCDRSCHLRHLKDVKQQETCLRNRLFNETRASIPLDLKTWMFKNNFHEISTHLFSILRREVYELVGRQLWKAVLVMVLGINFPNVVVQDFDGNITNFIFLPPEDISRIFEWHHRLTSTLAPGVFILMLDGCWNTHADKTVAAVHVSRFRILPKVPFQNYRRYGFQT